MASDYISGSDDDDEEIDDGLTSKLGISLNLPSPLSQFNLKQQRKALRVVSVFPRTKESFKAELDLVAVCKSIDAVHEQISFHRLDFGELSALDQFYSADIVIVDGSSVKEQATLFYHLGIRESFGMKDNLVLVYDEDDSKTTSVQVEQFNNGCSSNLHMTFAHSYMSFTLLNLVSDP